VSGGNPRREPRRGAGPEFAARDVRSVLAAALLGCGLCGGQASAEPVAPAVPAAANAGAPGVRGNRQALFDAWLSSDAVVVAAYAGVDSARGAVYHQATVEAVWAGTPARGPLWFKAPRGIRAAPGQRAILFLWDRLAGAPDAYLEEAKSRYGERVWTCIGPDSTTSYLLPFAAYAYKLDGNKLVLRGQRALPTSISLGDLETEILDWESAHTPHALYKRAAVVLRARVEAMDVVPRMEQGILIQRRVKLRLGKRELLKGDAPDSLALEFASLPRSPRFRAGDDVVLFLGRGTEGLFFEFGKRGAFHVVAGEVVEAGRPVAEFVKSLQSPR